MSIIVGDQISLFRKKVLLAGLKLEIAGMKRKGRSCYILIKEMTDLKGNKQRIYDQFKALIKEEEER